MNKITNDFFSNIVNDAIKIMKKPQQRSVAYLFNLQQLDCLKENCKFEFDYKIYDGYIAVWRKNENEIIKENPKFRRKMPPEFKKIVKKVDNKEISCKKACEILNISYHTFIKNKKRYEQKND